MRAKQKQEKEEQQQKEQEDRLFSLNLNGLGGLGASNWDAIKNSIPVKKRKQKGPGGAVFKLNDEAMRKFKQKSGAKSSSSSSAPPVNRNPDRVVAMDCEMVGVGEHGRESILARLSIVDYEMNCLFDMHVRPPEGVKVTDYRTKVTGITRDTYRYKKSVSFTQAQEKAKELMNAKTIVGHALHNDFQALKILPNKEHGFDEERTKIRDTQQYKGMKPKEGTPEAAAVSGVKAGGLSSLRGLAKIWLKETIQEGNHDSVEDARVAMRLYKMKERGWEKHAEDGRLRKKR